MSIKLKIKSKHLSEEARIIRFEERKQLKKLRRNIEAHKASGMNGEYQVWKDKHWQTLDCLMRHRKFDVRNEQRATFLARAYLAGIPYNKVEQSRKDKDLFSCHILPRVYRMVVKYGPRIDGDWQWDKVNNKYAPTKQLMDKIKEWSKL